MSRVPRSPVDPDNLQSIAQQQRDVIETVDNRIEFGEPLNPWDPTSVVLAGSGTPTTHNGIRSNILGSWVEYEFETLDDPITFNHNLYLEQPGGYVNEPVSGRPNCRWSVWAWEHDGATKTLWDDLRTPITSTKKAGNDPEFAVFKTDGGGSRGVFVDWFDAAGEEEVFFTAQLPHNYKDGTTVHPHLHWTPSANGNAGEVVNWGLEYTWSNPGDIFQNTTIISNNVHLPADDPLVADTHYYTDLGDIVNTGDTSAGSFSSMLVCRLFRDAAGVLGIDNYGSDAGLLEVDFHYEINGGGTDSEWTKTGGIELEWTPFNILFRTGDTVNANDIQLRCKAAPWMDVSSSHKLKVTLFFIKATR